MRSLGLYLYRSLFVPFFFLGMILAIPFSSKIRSGFAMRLRRNSARRKKLTSRPWWFHCASGEFEYAKPVIAELKARDPDTPIMVTYFSPTYARAVESHPLVDLAIPVPLDTKGAISSFLREHDPKALLISRTDLWPEMLHQCQLRGIPSILFAARRSSNHKFNWVARFRLSFLSTISASSEIDFHKFSELLGDSSHVLLRTDGDPRYDQVAARLARPKPLRTEVLKPSSSASPIFLAGSTWPKDEAVIFAAISDDLRAGRARLIVVPHEPTSDHVLALQAICKKNRLAAEVYTTTTNPSWQVLIVDKIGILAELYSQADLAYVGGGFGRGVHSVLEPLALGLLTFVGPRFANSREAIEFSNLLLPPSTNLKAVSSVSRPDDLRQLFNESLERLPQGLGKTKILDEMRAQRGASARLAQFILSL